MSAVLESPQISPGYATDGRMFEPPEINRDNEKPRYLTIIGSLVDPDTVRSRPWTKGGGIEVSNPCLRVVKNFLRKGRITPLLRDTHDYLPFDLVKKTTEVNPLSAGYFGQTIPHGYVPPSLPPANGQFQPGFGDMMVGGSSPYGNMVGKLALPGEQITAILVGSENMAQNNVPRGIRELQSLRGYDYRPNDSTINDMNLAIFPSYPALPVLLDDIQVLLDDATIHTSLREITDEMQESLTEFRSYADSTIQNTHNNMRESAGRRGYIWRYTAIDLVLLEQLGMARQDREIRAAATASNGGMETMFASFLQSQAEERAARIESDKRVAELLAQRDSETEKIDTQTMMASTPTVEVGYDGYPGASGYSGFSGEVTTSATPAGAEVIADTTVPTDKNGKPLRGFALNRYNEKVAKLAAEE